MIAFRSLFHHKQSAVIGMVHLRALPGSPQSKLTVSEITDIACREADIYSRTQVDGLMIENMNDRPWHRPEQLGPETVSAMAVVCANLRKQFPKIPMGVQVLCGGNREALSIAKAAGLNFIRAEGFVFSHVGDEGPVHSCAADLLRYRKQLAAEDVLIFTDVKKKHSSHAITADVSITDTALAAEMFLSDGIIVTGEATGKPADPLSLQDVQKAVKVPTLVGSGITIENVAQYLSADAMIIGSHLKMHGQWFNDLDAAQVKQFMSKVMRHRGNSDDNKRRREVADEPIVKSTVMDEDQEIYSEDSDEYFEITESTTDDKDTLKVKPLTEQGE